MVRRRRQLAKASAEVEFATPPWDETSAAWQAIDQRMPAQPMAREIDRAVEQLDLREVYATYQGRGSPPVRPDLLVKMILYELQIGRPSPAEGFHDSRDSDTLKWLGFGVQPARATFYAFRERAAPYWEGWNGQVLGEALAAGYTVANRGAQDGTTIAAHASRPTLLKRRTLEKRLGELDATITADEAEQAPSSPPRWMATQPATRRQQRERYERARERMAHLQAANLHRRACKRQDPEKIVVSASDPDAACGQDKLKTFRPLYTAQFIRDLDSPFILSYAVFNRATDAGTLGPTVDRMTLLTGRKPKTLLADSTYTAMADLEVCAQHALTLYAPVGENDYTAKLQRNPATNQFTQLPKTAFTWVKAEQTYRCPQGHPLRFDSCHRVQRAGGQRVPIMLFRCPPEYCGGCARRQECTPNPEKGRPVSRLANEDLLDALRQRMQTAEAKALYRQRAQTLELAFAEMKEHRSLRRLTGRGLRLAEAQVGAFVLGHNLLTLLRKANGHEAASSSTRILGKIAA
jgi:transposase